MAQTCRHCGARDVGDDHRCSSEMTTVKDASAARIATGRTTTSSEPDVPRKIAGRYEIRERAGGGGGGDVFRAYDRELEQEVALKVLRPDGLTVDILERLKREIRITRDIDHPNVSRVFDLFESDGRTFFTMRWIEGESLYRLVGRQGPLAQPALRRLAKGLVAALAAVHRKGVVHRDVKPGNVLVSDDGEPVLVDFGVALEGVSGPQTSQRMRRITPVGTAPGTPSYMPPEQHRGEARPSSDLWALALTLSFAATGEAGVPPDPARSFRALPRRLRSLLVRCLEEDPTRRPPDAGFVQRSLAIATRRRRTAAIAVAITLALAVGAVVAAPMAARRAVEEAVERAPPVVHVAPLANRTGDESVDWLEHGVPALMTAALEASGSVRFGVDSESLERAHRVEGGVIREGDRFVVQLLLRAPDGRVRSRAHIDRATGDGLFEGVNVVVRSFLTALGVEEAAGRGARGLGALPTHNVKALAHHARALGFLDRGQSVPALEEIRKATSADPRFALAHLIHYFLMTSGRHGSRAEAETALALAERHRDRLPPSQQELLAALQHADSAPASASRFDRLRAYLLAHPADRFVYRMATRLGGADVEFRRALAEEWAGRLPDDPEPHNMLAYLFLLELNDLVSAGREYRRYLELAPDEADAHDSYGDFLMSSGEFAEALRSYDRALEIDPTYAASAIHGVHAAMALDDFEDAERRLASARALVTPASREFVRWTQARAAVDLLRERPRGAVDRLEEIVRDPSTGSRGHVAREYEAIVRALSRDLAGARRAADEADRLFRLFHGGDTGLPSLRPWVEALAAHRRGDGRQLDRAVEALEALAPGVEERVARARLTVAEALGRAKDDPSGAAEQLGLVARLEYAEHGTNGVAFLAALERARALVAAGRPDDAKEAYDLAGRLRPYLIATAEAAATWRACERERAALP